MRIRVSACVHILYFSPSLFPYSLSFLSLSLSAYIFLSPANFYSLLSSNKPASCRLRSYNLFMFHSEAISLSPHLSLSLSDSQCSDYNCRVHDYVDNFLIPVFLGNQRLYWLGLANSLRLRRYLPSVTNDFQGMKRR